MELNTVLFRAPIPSYTSTRFGDELIWIPGQSDIAIPCLFLHSHQPTTTTFLFFHANAEDLGKVYDFLDIMRCVLEVNILAPEYPGYGIYKGSSTCNHILSDSMIVYKFLHQGLKLNPGNVCIVGRSIGTGPASWLASQGAGGLILLSPYTSIRKAAKSVFGKLLQYIIKDQFKNIEYMKKVTCPVLFIHGKKDKLIPFEHSYQLASVCQGKTTVFIPEKMTHNKFEFYDDVLCPIDNFLKENNIEIDHTQSIQIPSEYLCVPSYLKQQQDLLSDFL